MKRFRGSVLAFVKNEAQAMQALQGKVAEIIGRRRFVTVIQSENAKRRGECYSTSRNYFSAYRNRKPTRDDNGVLVVEFQAMADRSLCPHKKSE